MSRSLLLEERFEAAGSALGRAVRGEPLHWAALHSLLEQPRSPRQTLKNLRWLERHAWRNFRARWLRFLLGRMHLELLSDPTAAMSELERYVYREPSVQWAYPHLNRSYREAGAFERSKVFYRKLLSENPDSLAATLGLARMFMESAEFRDALDLLEQRLTRKPDEAALYRLRVEAIAAMGMSLEEQAAVYPAASHAPPSGIWQHLDLAELYRKHSLFEKASEAAAHGLAVASTSSETSALLSIQGRVAWNDRRTADAAALFKKAVGLDPYQPGLLIHLAKVEFLLGNRDGAWRVLEAAGRLGPGLRRVQIEVGKGFLDTQRPELAVVYLSRAARLDPTNPEAARLLEKARSSRVSGETR